MQYPSFYVKKTAHNTKNPASPPHICGHFLSGEAVFGNGGDFGTHCH